MPKTAAQLVPLRTQLANSLAIFRFNDPTTDFNGNLAYVELPYDNSGGVSGFGTTGYIGPSTSGAVPPTALAQPTNFALAKADAPSTSTAGLNRYHAGSQVYHLVYYDSANRQSQGISVVVPIPMDVYNASITFNLTYPAGAAGVHIYKWIGGNGCFYWPVPNTVSSMTDFSSVYSTSMSTQNGVAATGWAYPSPNSASQAPTIGPNDFTVTVNNTGGSFRATGYSYGLTAYNNLGETTTVPGQQMQITGSPLINGAATGRMNNISVADGPGAGTLEAGKWYYQVAAYTQTPNERYGSINGIIFRSGAGFNESLPSAEVSITRNAAGQNVVTWVPVDNAAGYVIYRSRDLPPPVQNALTTATTGGTLPAATTYYYVVTATNKAGETIASNEQTITTGGTATNTVTVSWPAVMHAYGYKVYRADAPGGPYTLLTTITQGNTVSYVNTAVTPTGATAANPPATSTALGAGQEVYLTQFAGGSTASWTDNGGSTPPLNSGFGPAKQYNGTFGVQQVTATWTPSASATGYYLYRFGASTVTNGQNGSAQIQAGQASTTSLDDAGATGPGWVARTTPNANYGGTSTLTMAGRYFTSHPVETVLRMVGFSFFGVQGKRYRFGVHNQSTGSNLWNSGYFTATTTQETYYEIPLSITIPASHNIYVYVQGEDAASTIVWKSNPVPAQDYPSRVQNEHGTWVAVFAANQGNAQNATMNSLGNGPTRVRVETGHMPMRVLLRRSDAGALINGASGTFLGDTQYQRYAFSPNRTYSTPVRAIVPNWGMATPVSPTGDQVTMAAKHCEIAVSTDGGSTFVPVQAGVRFVFPTPATQIQFRYTLPEASARMSFDRRVATGMPATDYAYQGAANYNHRSDSNHPMYNYANNNSTSMHYMKLNGHLSIAHNDNNYVWSNYAYLLNSWNADLSVTGYFDGESNNFGIRFRTVGKAYQGYFFYLNSAGDCGLVRQNNDATTVVTLATVTGATPPPVRVTVGQQTSIHMYTLRVICVNDHYLCFLNGRLVIDTTDTTYNTAAHGYHGITGARGIITNFSMTALSAPTLTTPWELEYVTAYLET